LNMKLAYQLWNQTGIQMGKPATGSPRRIVLLHGMGGTGALWRPIAASLEEDFEILAPDQRGHGKSQVPHIPGGRIEPTYTPLDYGRDTIETIDSLDFHPTWLIGHSMGVRSACAAAHLTPDWVQGLILIDLGFSGAAGGGLGDELGSFLKILPMEFPDRAQARTFMDENCPDPAIAQYLLAVSVRTPEGKTTFPFDKSALIQTIQAARNSSVGTWVEVLASRGMPVLVLRGANSLVWTHEEFEAEIARFAKYPSVKFEEFAGAGHGLPFEKRAEFVKRVREFVGE
jgi:esterase